MAFGLLNKIGGNFDHDFASAEKALSSKARMLVAASFEMLESATLADYHVHLLGLGSDGNGTFVGEELQSWKHPLKRLQFATYLSSAGITDKAVGCQQYLDRLIGLAKHMGRPCRLHLLAFDQFYDEEGVAVKKNTEFYVPNEYLFAVQELYPDIVEPIVSIHPYRKDAVEELQRCAERGAKMVKWLPNAMGIDPMHELVDNFYTEMKRLDMVLLSHTGFEAAVDSAQYQEFGNPLRLRRPLDFGIKVIMAHCGSLGKSKDLDHDDVAEDSVRLFFRMMEDERYEELLIADISAVTQVNRFRGCLAELLNRTEFHHRLVNGSDYPLPAINILFNIKKLVKAGFLDDAHYAPLKEIYNFNPLLFDFVLKRTLQSPDKKQGFDASIFIRKEGF